MASPRLSRVLFLLAAILLCLIAGTVGVAVIGPIRSDTFPGATPGRAIPALRFIAAFFTVMAVLLFVLARAKSRRAAFAAATIFIAVVLALVALPLLDAASAYRTHGPAMRGTSLLLYLCSAACLVVGVLDLVATFVLPRRMKAA